MITLFLNLIYLFLERGEGKEKERERNVNVWLPLMWDLAHNLGMCPDWELNQQPLGLQAGVQSTEPHQLGQWLDIYATWSHHLDKSSAHLAPYTVITILLSIFSILHFTSPWLFCNYQFVLLDPFTFFTIPPNPFPSGNCQNVLCILESVSVLLVHCHFVLFLKFPV